MKNRGRTVLVRADGGPGTGMGHIVRCAAITEALRAAGIGVCAIAGGGDAVRRVLAAAGAEVSPIAPAAGLAADASALLEEARRAGAGAVVLDLSSVNTDLREPADASLHYLEALRAHALPVLLVDDLLLLPRYPVPVIVNPNLDAESLHYPGAADGCLLLGARYAPLRAAFRTARALTAPIAERARRVTILLGGGASGPMLARVLDALAEGSADLEITAVVGPAGSVPAEVTRAAERARAAVRVAPDDVASILARSDLVVSGGGTSKYELAALGTPAILIPLVRHQESLTAAFARAGIAEDLGPGPFDAHRFMQTFEALCDDRAARARMRARGRTAVDGFGVERIAAAVREELLRED